jgi:hypothetical protein
VGFGSCCGNSITPRRRPKPSPKHGTSLDYSGPLPQDFARLSEQVAESRLLQSSERMSEVLRNVYGATVPSKRMAELIGDTYSSNYFRRIGEQAARAARATPGWAQVAPAVQSFGR